MSENKGQFVGVRRRLGDFHCVTGLAAKLIRTKEPKKPIEFGAQENEFCREVAAVLGACRACHATQLDLLARLLRKQKPQKGRCPAGLVQFAYPVLSAGKHVASIVGGKARVAADPVSEMCNVADFLRQAGIPDASEISRLSATYLRIPNLTAEEFQSATRLLDSMAQTLVRKRVSRSAAHKRLSPIVDEAIEFVQEHFPEKLTTNQVSHHVKVSVGYFCRHFRKETGMRFHAYLAQVRVQAAKALLRTSSQDVTSIATAVGFQSITDFNRVFKRTARVTPSGFRRELRIRPNRR